ncbi:MAG: hypothetical protein NVS1B9_05280 [Solirubrobacteraceae bacterium]
MAKRSDRAEIGLTRAALRNPAVRQIVGGFAGVTLAEWVLGTTVAIYAYSVGGALAVGLVGFRFAPAAIAGVWTTQLAERRRRQRILTLTAATRGAATGIAALALALQAPFALVVALVWLDAAAGSAYRPTQAAVLPSLAQTPGELTATTALASNVKSSGQILGALLGGVLVATMPIAVAVGAAALLYLLAAALTAAEHTPHPLALSLRTHARGGFGSLGAGAALLSRDREARTIVLFACARALVRGLWVALAVVASLRLLSLGESGLGVLMAAAGVGAVAAIAATVLLIGNRRLAGWFAAALIMCGLPIVATGLTASAPAAVAFMIVWGAGMSLSDVGAQTLLNRIVPAASIGRVTGAMESAKLLFEGAGSLLAPLLLGAVGVRGSLYVAGGTLPVVVLLGLRSFARIDDRAVDRVAVLELLRAVRFFSSLRLDALEGVAARLHLQTCTAGTEIVRQGEVDAHRWYLIESGELDVYVDGFRVGALGRGEQFGERSLLRGVPRSATVRARDEVVLYALERADFLAAVAGPDLEGATATEAPQRGERVEPAEGLARAPLLRSLDPPGLARLRRQMAVIEFAAGSEIVSLGASEDTYHVMLSGTAEVLIDGAVRRELLPGDAVGEIAVLHRVPRTATVVVRDPASVLMLDGDAVRAAVREHGGPVGGLAS